MPEPLFFKSAKSLTVAEIAALTGAQLAGGVPLDRGDDTFGDGVNMAARLQETAAPRGVCLPPRRRN